MPFTVLHTHNLFTKFLTRPRSTLGLLQFVEAKSSHRLSRFPSHRQFPFPKKSNRRPNFKTSFLGNPSTVFWGILFINGVTFVTWRTAFASYNASDDPSSLIFMNENFLVNLKNVREGRIWCLLTACFSHEGTSHLLFNGLSYFFMARPVLAMLGNKAFLTLYIGGGVFASVASLAWRNLRGGKPTDSSHGASAAIYAIITFFACVQPRTTFLIFGAIPCPAWAWVGGIFLFDGYSALADRKTQIDSMGHISGMLAGVGYFLMRRVRFRI